MDASNDNEHIYTPLPSHLSPLPPPPSPSHEEQQVRSMDTEVDNFKKNITKEQERNEQLTLTLNKVTSCTHSYGSVWHCCALTAWSTVRVIVWTLDANVSH